MTDLSKVLLTTSTFPRHEDDRVTARFILDLAQHLAAHVGVVVLAPAAPGTTARQRWGDVTVVRYRYFAPARFQLATRGAGMLAALRGSLAARLQVPLLVGAQWAAIPGLVRRERIDLVNSHWIVPQGFTAALWRRRLAVPHVVTAHGADVALLERFTAGRMLARFIFRRTDYFISASEYLATQTERLLQRAIPHRAIPMGVSPGVFVPSGASVNLHRTEEERVILFVGKLVPKKGMEFLVDATAHLRAAGVPVRLVVIGGGPLEAALRAQILRLGLQNSVELLGWVRNDQLPEYYRAADVVAVPSIRDSRGETEGTPVVLQEALASGAVVVASDSSGIPDVVRDGVNGWLVPPADGEGLARVLRRALAMGEAERTLMRRAARDAALEYAWERVAERYLEVFRLAATRAGGDAWLT